MNRQNDFPRIDVLILTYNQDSIVSHTIDSVCKQTYPNLKIIIADDNSKDKTREVIDSWYQKFPDKIIRVYNERNLGITGNSNAALAESKGEYLVIMGGDDILYPTKVQEQFNWFTKNPDNFLCGHSMDIINEDGIKTGPYSNSPKKKGKGAFNWIEYGMLFGCMSIMIKTTDMGGIRFDNRLYYSSDLKFFIDFLGSGKMYGFVDKNLGAYRKASGSITVKKWYECLKDSEIMYDILKKEAGKEFKRHVIRGHNYLVNYGLALKHFSEAKYSTAFKGFLKVLGKDFLLWKAYFRLAQSALFFLKTR